MNCPIAFKYGLIRYTPVNDGLPINGWMHTCVWCETITNDTTILLKNLFQSPERIKTLDGNSVAFNGIIVYSCPICKHDISDMVTNKTRDMLSRLEKNRMCLVEEKMVQRMRLKRPNFVRYE